MKTLLKSVVAVMVTTLAVACGGGGSDSSGPSCGALNARIFGGESCDQNARTAVVLIRTAVLNAAGEELSAGFCTGTLVTLDDVLTSAHCLTGELTSAALSGQRPAAAVVEIFAGGAATGQVIPANRVAIHPLYNGRAGSRHDVAMFTLARMPQPRISPVPLLISELTGPGSPITAYGYGTNQDGILGELRSADFTVSRLAEGNLLVRGDGDSSICPGDSGGPAVYITTQGVATVAGINSFGEIGGCERSASRDFGFVDVQFPDILEYIVNFAPDVAAG